MSRVVCSLIPLSSMLCATCVFLPALCYPLFGLTKTVLCDSPSSLRSSTSHSSHRDRTPDRTKKKLVSVDPRSRAQPDPEPSPPSFRCAESKPEPTDDGEPEPASTNEPLPNGATVLRIAAVPELQVMSDQVREPATTPAMRENAMNSERARRGAPPPAPWLRVSLMWIWDCWT